ncbi:MAG: DUF4376 domain-containing protein [Mariprofundaceae bacterium]
MIHTTKQGWVDSRLQSIRQLKTMLQTSPIEVTLPSGTYIVQTDTESRSLLSGLVALIGAGAITTPTKWTMADNAEVDLSPTEAVMLAGAIAAHIAAVHWSATAHKSAIRKAILADLKTYDCSTGWPTIWQAPLV